MLKNLKKDQRKFCARESKKISIVVKNVNGSVNAFMHKAERAINYFSTLPHIIRLNR